MTVNIPGTTKYIEACKHKLRYKTKNLNVSEIFLSRLSWWYFSISEGLKHRLERVYKDVKELHVKWHKKYKKYSIQNAQLPSASEQAGIEMTVMGGSSRRPAPASGSKSQKEINYWDLFVKRCQQESVQIQKSNWILTEDVLSCSATATIAVPGVAIGIFTTGFLKCFFKIVRAKCLKKLQSCSISVVQIFLKQRLEN